jgi:hypothetical protein
MENLQTTKLMSIEDTCTRIEDCICQISPYVEKATVGIEYRSQVKEYTIRAHVWMRDNVAAYHSSCDDHDVNVAIKGALDSIALQIAGVNSLPQVELGLPLNTKKP